MPCPPCEEGWAPPSCSGRASWLPSFGQEDTGRCQRASGLAGPWQGPHHLLGLGPGTRVDLEVWSVRTRSKRGCLQLFSYNKTHTYFHQIVIKGLRFYSCAKGSPCLWGVVTVEPERGGNDLLLITFLLYYYFNKCVLTRPCPCARGQGWVSFVTDITCSTSQGARDRVLLVHIC